MPARDPHGYYSMLNVDPDSSAQEIEVAFQLLREAHRQRPASVDLHRIKVAHAVLASMERRQSYDKGAFKPSGVQVAALTLPRLLAGLVALLTVLLLYVNAGSIRTGMTSYAPGDRLYWTETGAFAGEVRRYEASHVFVNGAVAAAYLMETDASIPAIWYPARDLAQLCEQR